MRSILIPFLVTSAAFAAGNNESPVESKLVAHVLQRVHESEPSRGERSLDAIGWAPNIREAQMLARQNDRPIFLFTHDGNIATGRC